MFSPSEYTSHSIHFIQRGRQIFVQKGGQDKYIIYNVLNLPHYSCTQHPSNMKTVYEMIHKALEKV